MVKQNFVDYLLSEKCYFFLSIVDLFKDKDTIARKNNCVQVQWKKNSPGEFVLDVKYTKFDTVNFIKSIFLLKVFLQLLYVIS